MEKVIINIEYNYSGKFVDRNGKYCTTHGSYFREIIYSLSGIKNILLNFDCMVYITCPKGKMQLHIQPKIDADNFKCIELRDESTLFSEHRLGLGISEFENHYGEDVDVSRAVVEYLYDKGNYNAKYNHEPCWYLKEEIREEIINIINENLESYIKIHGYEELYEMTEWNK